MVRSFYFLVSHSSRVSVFSIVSSFTHPLPTLDVDATGESPEYTRLRLETEIETVYLDPRGTGYGDGFTPSILSFSSIHSSIHILIHLRMILVSLCPMSVWMESGIEIGCCGKEAYLSSGSWSDAARVGKFPKNVLWSCSSASCHLLPEGVASLPLSLSTSTIICTLP